MAIKLFHRDEPDLYSRSSPMTARLVVWPGVGSEMANMNYVVLEPGEENVPHAHSESEDTIFILEGRGSVADLDNDCVLEFEAGDAVHVPVGVKHTVAPIAGVGLSAWRAMPPDRFMLELCGAL